MVNNVIVYATCQGVPFRDLLLQSAEFLENFNVEYYSNFSSPGSAKFGIEKEKLDCCDFFLYHPIKNAEGTISIDKILDLLPNNCITLPLPYVTFSAYWPDFEKIPSSPLGKSQQFPYGKIPYRSRFLEEIIKNKSLKKHFFDEYLELDEEIRKASSIALISDLDYLSRLDNRDGPFFIRDYVEKNYKNRQLFHIFNHPKNVIYLHLVNQFLIFLGCKELPLEMANNIAGHVEQNLPIHPSTAISLKLDFIYPAKEYLYLDKFYTFRQFVDFYISLSNI